jgi:hypothetical protein
MVSINRLHCIIKCCTFTKAYDLQRIVSLTSLNAKFNAAIFAKYVSEMMISRTAFTA